MKCQIKLTVGHENDKNYISREKKLEAFSMIFFTVKSGIGSMSRCSETSEHSTPFYRLCSTLTRSGRQDKAWARFDV